MTIEEKLFARLRFERSRMEENGFVPEGDGYVAVIPFMDGDFTAELRVLPDGTVRGTVRDNMNDEEYAALRNPLYNGAYVNTVRSEYEELLRGIAADCCREVGFAADQSNRIAEWILQEYGVSPDFPWDGDTSGVFRHTDTAKWFGLIMNIRRGQLDKNDDKTPVDVMNLKIDESDAEILHKEKGIYPAWHMNHRTWISVLLDDTLGDIRVRELIAVSFALTDRKGGRMDDAFIRKVLVIADSVPYGKVATYGQIARLAGREKNSRLVGKIMSMADRYGSHPCHRIVNSAGRTVPGWEEQRGLLEAEGITFRKNGCVDMEKHRWDR